MLRRWFILLFLVSLFSVTIQLMAQDETSGDEQITPQPIPNRSVTNACLPADVVVLIDQSTSMETNDQSDKRIDAVQSVIDSLHINAAITCEGIVTHRFATIGFSDETALLIDPLQIFVADASSVEWEDNARAIRNTLISAASRNSGGQTSLAEALVGDTASARTVFEQWDNEVLGDETPRQSVIIVVTDGNPCTPTAANCSTSGWVEHYFFANNRNTYPLDEYADYGFDTQEGLIRELELLLDPSIEINAFLFNRNADPNVGLFGRTNEAWNVITGTRGGIYVPPEEIGRLSDITADMNEIISDALGLTQETLACNVEFYLEPYISATTIVGSVRPNVSSSISVISPNGQEISSSTNVSYNRLETYENYIITNPAPGAWQISGDPALCEDIYATLETVPVDVEILLPDEPVPVELDAPYVAADNDRVVRIHLTDRRNSRPIEELPGFPIEVCLQVSGPLQAPVSEISNCIGMSSVTSEPGIWQADQALPAPLQGIYEISVAGRIASVNPANNGQMIEVFSINQVLNNDGQVVPATYETLPPIPVRLDVDIPESIELENSFIVSLNTLDDSGQQVHSPVGVSVRVVPVDDPNSPIPLSEVFRSEKFPSLDELVEASMTGLVSDTILMSDSSDVTFSGFLRAEGPASGLDPEGTYTLNFRLVTDAINNYNQQNYVFVADGDNVTVQVERLQIEGVAFRDAIVSDTPSQILLNTVNPDGTLQNAPVPVQVKLVNQNGASLDVFEIFGNEVDTNNLVSAVLSLPGDVATADEIQLSLVPGTTDEFEGTFLSDPAEVIGPAGEYIIRVFFTRGVSVPIDNQDDFRLLANVNSPLTIMVERIPRFAVTFSNARVASPAGLRDSADGTVFPMNSIGDEFTQVPLRYEIQAQLVDPSGQIYQADEIEQMLAEGALANDLMSAIVSGPDNIEATLPVTYDSTESIFTTTFSTLDGTSDLLDPEGVYKVRFEIITGNFTSNSLASYETISNAIELEFFREEQHAVELILQRLGNTQNPADSEDTTLTIPLYLNFMEAWGRPVLPWDASPQSVPFEFVILDTDGAVVPWELIIDEDATVGDASIMPDVDAEATEAADVDAEATEQATAENQNRAPGVSDFVQIRVQTPDSNSAFRLSDLEVVEEGESQIIRGFISSEAATDGEYILTYQLTTAFLSDDVQNFSGNLEEQAFQREITAFYLNPEFYNIVDYILIVLIVLWLLRFYWINFHDPMRGNVSVTFKRNVDPGERNKTQMMGLGGIKLLHNRKSKQMRVPLVGNKGEMVVRVTVTKIASQSQGGAGRSPSIQGKVETYEVKIEGKEGNTPISEGPFNVSTSRSQNFGQTASVKHELPGGVPRQA